jgi:hypothetical protein
MARIPPVCHRAFGFAVSTEAVRVFIYAANLHNYRFSIYLCIGNDRRLPCCSLQADCRPILNLANARQPAFHRHGGAGLSTGYPQRRIGAALLTISSVYSPKIGCRNSSRPFKTGPVHPIMAIVNAAGLAFLTSLDFSAASPFNSLDIGSPIGYTNQSESQSTRRNRTGGCLTRTGNNTIQCIGLYAIWNYPRPLLSCYFGTRTGFFRFPGTLLRRSLVALY